MALSDFSKWVGLSCRISIGRALIRFRSNVLHALHVRDRVHHVSLLAVFENYQSVLQGVQRCV